MVITNKYSRKFVQVLADVNSNIFNYTITKENHSLVEDTINTVRITQSNKARKEENLETGNTILYYDDLKIDQDNMLYYEIESEEIDEAGNKVDIKLSTSEIISWYPLENQFESFKYINSNSEYKFLKTEKYNGSKCIVVEFIYNDYNEIIRVWFNLKNGIIEKEEYYKQNELESVVTYKAEINNVTDTKIYIPDLKEYTYTGKITIFPQQIQGVKGEGN